MAPTVWTPPTAHQQLHTRPPTDDAALRRHPTDPDRRHKGESGEARGARGTLIHHAAARAIRSLPVAMVKPPFRTLLVTPAGRPHAGASGGVATARRAVDVSAIAARTDAEGLGARSTRAHVICRLHEAAAPSARPRSPARLSGRMNGDWFGLPQRRVGHEGLEPSLQVLTLLGRAHLISTRPVQDQIDVCLPNRRLCVISR